MDFVRITFDIIIILIGIVGIQSKKHQEINKSAMSTAFVITFCLYTIIGISSLILSTKIEASSLDFASGLALIYVVSLVYMLSKEKKQIPNKVD